MSQPWSEPGAPVHLLLAGVMTDLHHRWRSGEQARPLLDRLDRVLGTIDTSAVHPGILFSTAYLELRLAEASQDLSRVAPAVARVPADMAEARVLRAEGQRVRRAYGKGRDELRPVFCGEIPPMWDSSLLLALALDGVLAHLDGSSDTGSLQQAVQMAQRTGRRGPFLDLGGPMYETLVARRSALPSHDGFVDELIEELRRHEPARLPEPLTHAELRVLRHLDSMATLQEIATGLNLSRNTVKTHTTAVYRKLEISSRREAVARGRMLGLL